MAKKSMVNREVKRTELAKKFAKKRAELKTIIKDEDRSYEDREEARRVCRSCRATRARCAVAIAAA